MDDKKFRVFQDLTRPVPGWYISIKSVSGDKNEFGPFKDEEAATEFAKTSTGSPTEKWNDVQLLFIKHYGHGEYAAVADGSLALSEIEDKQFLCTLDELGTEEYGDSISAMELFESTINDLYHVLLQFGEQYGLVPGVKLSDD